MKLLLDTHALIWFVEDKSELPRSIKNEIEQESNQIYVSMASLWEIAIKMKLGKLDLSKSIEEIMGATLQNGFELLPILPEHIVRLSALDFFHRDPFDRMIIAQGLDEQMTIVGKDEIFDSYGVHRIWK